MLPVRGKKAVLEWCMKEGLIRSSYGCPKCGKSMELRERTEPPAGKLEAVVPFMEKSSFYKDFCENGPRKGWGCEGFRRVIEEFLFLSLTHLLEIC
ncbi:hypothetical protein TNCV_495401 [Trichonephila clavipes]|nr:hypothetical protein TNCV_495401 [Trichonephila clavipes]